MLLLLLRPPLPAEHNSTRHAAADAASLAVHALATGPDYDGVVELMLNMADDLRALGEMI